MKKLLDRNDPFFSKPWRKWATIAVPLFWGVAEMVMGSPGWGWMFLALGGFAAWELVLRPARDNE